MDSQTSADANDIINQFYRSCSCSNLSDTTFGVSNGCCAKEIVDKLMVQLKEKDEQLKANKIQLEEKNKELEANKEEIKNLSAEVRANRAHELETELTNARKTIAALQLNLWKSFPSNFCCYYIKVKLPSGSERHLYVDQSDQLRLVDQTLWATLRFKFTRNTNGTYSIYSFTKKKYLQTQPPSKYSRVIFSATDEESAGQFVLFFHQNSQQSGAGLLVDISSLTGYFLSTDYENYIVVNSSDVPANKFLFVPGDD